MTQYTEKIRLAIVALEGQINKGNELLLFEYLKRVISLDELIAMFPEEYIKKTSEGKVSISNHIDLQQKAKSFKLAWEKAKEKALAEQHPTKNEIDKGIFAKTVNN